jgi:hypothetical protein
MVMEPQGCVTGGGMIKNMAGFFGLLGIGGSWVV